MFLVLPVYIMKIVNLSHYIIQSDVSRDTEHLSLSLNQIRLCIFCLKYEKGKLL